MKSNALRNTFAILAVILLALATCLLPLFLRLASANAESNTMGRLSAVVDIDNSVNAEYDEDGKIIVSHTGWNDNADYIVFNESIPVSDLTVEIEFEEAAGYLKVKRLVTEADGTESTPSIYDVEVADNKITLTNLDSSYVALKGVYFFAGGGTSTITKITVTQGDLSKVYSYDCSPVLPPEEDPETPENPEPTEPEPNNGSNTENKIDETVQTVKDTLNKQVGTVGKYVVTIGGLIIAVTVIAVVIRVIRKR